MKKAKDVDEFIADAPKEAQERLKQIRAAIKEVAPEATEKISYGIAFYHYIKRLVYFGYAKKHVAIYGITHPVIEQYKSELEKNITGKGTISFPHDGELSIGLIKKLVLAQKKLNETAAKKS